MAASTNQFEALDDFLGEGLDLPVRGEDGQVRTYHIADPSAEAGIKIERITSYAARLAAGGAPAEGKILDDEEEINLYRLCLGDAYDELEQDLSWTMFKHVALTVMFWVTTDEDTAREFWATGQAPGKARNRQERRQTSRGSSARAAANGTPSPASMSGTRAASPRRSRGGQGRGPRPI